jgi:arsenate reductase (glutaredoxin)
MKKMYYLSTCSTSARIMKDCKITPKGFELQDIKTQPITPAQLDEMKKMAGSYEALFPKPTTEKEYRKLILEEYTFLKRPVAIIGDQIFVGNSKTNVANLQKAAK